MAAPQPGINGQTMRFFNSPAVPSDAATGLLATVNVAANGTLPGRRQILPRFPNGLRRISVLSSQNPNQQQT